MKSAEDTCTEKQSEKSTKQLAARQKKEDGKVRSLQLTIAAIKKVEAQGPGSLDRELSLSLAKEVAAMLKVDAPTTKAKAVPLIKSFISHPARQQLFCSFKQREQETARVQTSHTQTSDDKCADGDDEGDSDTSSDSSSSGSNSEDGATSDSEASDDEANDVSDKDGL